MTDGFLALLATFASACSAAQLDLNEAELSADIHLHELKAHVYRLASPEFVGRRGPGAVRASRHIADAFERLKLQPLFDDGSYFQPIPSLALDKETGKEGFIGRNVGAVLPGSDPKLKDEWVIIAAHFDHLGKRGEVLYPGADDNASGVAMLLEVAEAFALAKQKPRRTVAFVSFDQEESGLLGSTYFVNHPPHPIRQVKAFVVADMLGRSMANVMDDYVFVLGSETSPRLRKLVEEMKPENGLSVGRLGADLIGTRSDYGPFRDRNVPFLFFSTGVHRDYHTPNDTPDRIDFEKARKICNWIFDLTAKLADADKPPIWEKNGLPPEIDEVRTILIIVDRMLNKPDVFPLTEKQQSLVKSFRDKLAAMVERGNVTQSERTTLLWTSRLLMATLLK